MGNWSGGGKREAASKGWRGKQQSASEATPRWQSRPAGTGRSSKASRRRWQSHWLIYSSLGAVLLTALVYFLLSSPDKTPFIMALGINYEAPIPPNEWVYEDGQGFQELRTLSTDSILDESWVDREEGGWRESEGGKAFLSALGEHKKLKRRFRQIREPLVIYFSMPGVVDEGGQPCLLPPGASALNSKDWIKVADIVKEIGDAIPSERNKLLILDSNQELINWDLGIVYNTFTERLKQLVDSIDDKDASNLAVLTAADVGQVSWSSPLFGGSAFGHFLRQGFMGSADLEGGDSNGEVSLNELAAYLRSSVGEWSKSDRGALQEPLLLKDRNDLNFIVTYALNSGKAENESTGPHVTAEVLGSLWEQFDKIKESDALRFDPLRLSAIERRLLRLEQLASGGEGYGDEADILLRELETELAPSKKNAKASIHSLPDSWAVINHDDASRVRLAAGESYVDKLNCLPLRLFFGQCDDASPRQVSGFLVSMSKSNGLKASAPENASQERSLMADAYVLPQTQLLIAAQEQEVVQGIERRKFLDQLLRLRQQADILAVPSMITEEGSQWQVGDERAHYYTRGALAEAERKRRLAEDALFSGTIGSDERQKWLEDATRLYSTANETQQSIATAFELLDQSYSELPYLANWVCDLALQGKATKELSIDNLNDLIGQTHHLSHVINDFDPTSGRIDVVGKLKEIQGATRTLQGALKQFRDEFDNQVENLKDEANDAEDQSNLEAVLATPLVEVEVRKTLLDHREKAVQRKLDKIDFTKTVSAEKIAEWSSSPLLSILEISTPDTKGTLDRLEDICWAARKKLLSLGNAIEESDRQALSKAERQVRAAAAFGFEPSTVNPILQLRIFDLQQLLIWHARRTLDDFWHAILGSEPTLIADQHAPQKEYTLFAVSTNTLLESINELDDSPRQEVQKGILEVERLLKERLAASKNGITIGGKTSPAGTKEIEIVLGIGRGSGESALPEGQGAVSFTAAQGRLAESPFEKDYVGFPFENENPVEFTGIARGVEGKSMDAMVFFRGRRYREPIEVRPLGGALVAYEPPVPDGQSITLKGDQLKKPATVFILDCSSSMQFTMPVEGGLDKSRMDIAKAAFGNMLEELSQQTARPKIGVYFYGHRVAWDLKHFRETKTYKAVGPRSSSAPPGLVPGDDVEPILNLRVFYPRENSHVSERLAGVNYHGATPVYLAIRKALTEFKTDEPDYDESIVVITDGINKQEALGSTLPEIVNLRDVINDWEAKKNNGLEIPIHIVGFALSGQEGVSAEDAAANKKAIEEFTSLAKRTRGQFVPAETEKQLIEYLEKQKKSSGYVVRKDDGTPLTKDLATGEEEPVELGSRVLVPVEDPNPPSKFEILFRETVSKQVVLEGGEALEMRVKEDGTDIQGIPYNQNVAAPVMLKEVGSNADSNYLLRIHTPMKSDEGVDFRFSVQDIRSHFTSRPLEVWAEVTPQGSTQTYRFYDRVFELGTPVPVISFKASGWPAASSSATIRFWCTYKEVAPLREQVLSACPPTQNVEKVIVNTSVEKSGAGFNLRVDEEHSDKSTLGTLRVRVLNDNPAINLKAVSHRFDDGNLLVQHQYSFDTGLSADEFKKNVVINIVSAKDLKESSLRLPEAGEQVDVVKKDDRLSPTSL